MMHTLFKIQTILNYCPKVIACWNLCPLNGRPRIFTISNLHNFCNTTPNTTCEHNLESSWHKKQSPKVSIQKNPCSMSYTPSKFSPNPRLPPHTHSTKITLLKNSPLTFFFLKWTWTSYYISPSPCYPTLSTPQGTFTFLSFPFFIHIKSPSLLLIGRLNLDLSTNKISKINK